MNPYKCGYLDDPGQAFSQAQKCAQDYQAKPSGPLYDRIDLQVEGSAEVEALSYRRISPGRMG